MVIIVKDSENDFTLSGKVSNEFIEKLQKEFGKSMKVIAKEEADLKSVDSTARENLRLYRKLYMMTQEELAEKIGVSKQHVSDMERGKKEISKKTAIELSKLFEVTPARFI